MASNSIWKRALELDESLAEAHTTLAYAELVYNWDSLNAEKEFQRAIALNPNYSTAHFWYAACLAAMNRVDEAVAQCREGQQLDPLSLIIQSGVAWMYHFARRDDRAIEESQKALELDPDFVIAHFRLAIAYEQESREAEAISEFKKAVTLSNRGPDALAQLGHAYATFGYKAEAVEILKELDRRSKEQYVSSYDIAEIYTALGDRNEAFAWLKKACAERSWSLAFVRIERRLDGLRSDPRFADVIRCVEAVSAQ